MRSLVFLLPIIGLTAVCAQQPETPTAAPTATLTLITEVAKELSADSRTRVTVLGQFARPGNYKIDGVISVAEAIQLAGGVTRIADERKFVIISPTEGNKLIWRGPGITSPEGKSLSSRIFLRGGDILRIDEGVF